MYLKENSFRQSFVYRSLDVNPRFKRTPRQQFAAAVPLARNFL
jgi:hypothetical protein